MSSCSQSGERPCNNLSSRFTPRRRRNAVLMIASVSGNDVCRICFRFFTLSCCLWFTLVRWRPLLSAAIVTQLVTRPLCARVAWGSCG